jgi:hypothetical protein
MVEEMINKVGDVRVVKRALRNMLALGDTEVDYLVGETVKRVRVDYVGLK